MWIKYYRNTIKCPVEKKEQKIITFLNKFTNSVILQALKTGDFIIMRYSVHVKIMYINAFFPKQRHDVQNKQ